jgi:hypothetical protein
VSMSHVAAPDPSPSGKWELRAHVGLKTWVPSTVGLDARRESPGPLCEVRIVLVEVKDPPMKSRQHT